MSRLPSGLSQERWAKLVAEYRVRQDVPVRKLCREYGVSAQRLYKRFPGGNLLAGDVTLQFRSDSPNEGALGGR